ncbi:MAG: DUF1232 domain-containing protein [Cytophagales bacterium]|nr:DUF1232 domain-containing protein [Cytophagales bacterium]
MRFYNRLQQQARKLKAEGAALYHAYRDHRTPWTAKLLIAFTLAYLLSPVDLVPDFIPVLGQLDDLLIVPLLVTLSIRLIPAEVIDEARTKAVANGGIGKRTNWVVGGLVVALWILVGYKLCQWAWPYLQNGGSNRRVSP